MAQENTIVSIVVPVYNMEKTIARCLDSIVGQDYKNIEVILINDGSVDNTAEICEKYAKQYGSIRYYSRENRGLPYTLQEGIGRASGSFLAFVDSDDYVEHNMISTLRKAQQEVDADVVQSGIAYIRVDGGLKGRLKMKDNVITDQKSLFYAYYITKSMNNTMAGALFRRSLFEGISFSYDLLSIDIQVMPLILLKCGVFRQISDVLYNAVQYPNSVSRGARIDRMYEDRKMRAEFLESFFAKHVPYLSDYMFYRRAMDSLFLYKKCREQEENSINDKSEFLMNCKKDFKKSYPLLLKSNLYAQYDKVERICLSLFNVNPILYFRFITIYEKLLNSRI